MADVDIVARLRLNAEQFSSETGQRFAELRTRAQSSAAEIRQSFAGALGEVQKLAGTALVLPRTGGGSLDLSAEIAQLRESAAASDQKAIALRELSMAYTAASAAAGVDAEAQKLEADAAAVMSLAAEKDAAATRDRIVALEAVQAELNKTVSATERSTAANQASAISAGQHRQGVIQLGEQFRQFATEVQLGINPVTAFTQQSGQAAFALSNMQGKLGQVGAFLAGPYGTGLLIGASLLGALVAENIKFTTALDDEIDKLKQSAAAEDVARQAKERFKTTEEGVAAAIRDGTDATKKSIEAQRSAAEQASAAARENLRLQFQYENTTLAQLRAAKAAQDILAGPGISSERGIGVAQQAARDQAAALQAKINDQAELVRQAKARVDQTDIDLAVERGKRAADPIAGINKQYDDMLDKAEAAARGNAKLTATLQAQTTAIERNRQAALDRAKKDNRQPPSLGSQLQAEQSARLLDSASRYRGQGEGTGNTALRDLFKQANIPVDPKITAWCAAFVNAVLATNGLPGTGSLSARSFLGYGSATDKPERGDIVVARRGTGNEGHVGFYEGTDARGNIQVLGGNTGNRVATETIARADVLGFRRAPSAADSYKAEEASAKRLSDLNRQAADDIARINARWDEQPRLIDQARLQTNRLDEIIADLAKQRPPGFEKLIADAEKAKGVIQEGLNRPFKDFVDSQRESAAIEQLTLQGRDAEASALQTALRLQQQGVDVDEKRLVTILAFAQQQERISQALEDQRRIVGIYTGAVGEMQHGFESFLADLRTKPGDALKNLGNSILGSFTHLGDQLLSNALFGGIDRDVEKYIRQMTGRQTPAELLQQQAGDAGTALGNSVGAASSALDDLVRAFRSATDGIRGAGPVNPVSDASARQMLTGGFDMKAANDNAAASSAAGLQDLVRGYLSVDLTGGAGKSLAGVPDAIAKQAVNLSSVFGVGVDRFVQNLDGLGVKLPASITGALKKGLPTVLQGISAGQLGGSIFSSISGKNDNGLASGLGGIIGDVAGKALGKSAGGLLGNVLGPIGGLVGGVLGGIVGGLFAPTPRAQAGISVDKFGYVKAGTASGSSADLRSGASTLAGTVANTVQQIADQLGAKVTGSTDVNIGIYKGDYHVNDHGGTIGQKGSGDVNFSGDQAAAISFAVAAALQDGILSGISQASLNILKSGQDLQKAITKAMSIEAIPKDLKAALDPVGAAIDTLNTKWQKTVDALKEGGATADQMAQAQQLYNIQLADTKNSTASASQALKDFLTSLNVGSSSPYSLRDQEATAYAQLRPFLDQIAGGQRIDQGKYQTAAQAYLDVERQLYGSTQDYFNALDAIQASTNKAIASLDNVQSVSPDVASPFAEATAANTGTVAENTATANDLLAQNSELLANIGVLMQQNTDYLAAMAANSNGGFIGDDRLFTKVGG
jgi:uncharacterized protein (TIGR02594 family)